MVQEAVLMRATQKVSNYIEKYVTVAGAGKREEVLELFDSMHRLFPQWVIMTCPVMHPDLQYISRNSPVIFGHSIDYLIRNSSITKYFNHVHDADQQDLYDCFEFIQDHLESVLPEEHPDYRFALHYRFRKGNGQYMYLYDEKAVLSLRNSGNLYYSLYRDNTAEKSFAGVKVELFKQNLSLHKIKEFKPSAERRALSKREGELVSLIRQGLSTKEIAWHLKISHHTVRNIKSRLFEKLNVNNTVELLNITG